MGISCLQKDWNEKKSEVRITHFNSKDITFTPAMEEHTYKALEKSFKRIAFPNDDTFTIKASIVDKKTKLIKVELSGFGFRAQCVNKDFYSAVTAVANKFKTLAVKQNKKYITKKKRVTLVEDLVSDLDSIEPFVSKEKIFFLDSYDISTAISKFEQTDYSFYIFRDIDANEEVVVLYRRADDTFGIIRCR